MLGSLKVHLLSPQVMEIDDDRSKDPNISKFELFVKCVTLVLVNFIFSFIFF